MKKTSLGSKKPTPKFMQEAKQDNKSRSARHEKRLEKVLRSKTTLNSGALPELSNKGDLRDSLFVWQAKLTKSDKITLSSEVIVELCRQASLTGLMPAICTTLEGLDDHIEKDWVIIPSSVFAELIDIYKSR